MPLMSTITTLTVARLIAVIREKMNFQTMTKMACRCFTPIHPHITTHTKIPWEVSSRTKTRVCGEIWPKFPSGSIWPMKCNYFSFFDNKIFVKFTVIGTIYYLFEGETAENYWKKSDTTKHEVKNFSQFLCVTNKAVLLKDNTFKQAIKTSENTADFSSRNENVHFNVLVFADTRPAASWWEIWTVRKKPFAKFTKIRHTWERSANEPDTAWISWILSQSFRCQTNSWILRMSLT